MAYTHPASAQKFIKIDDQLREHSQPMTVKRKGFNAVGKWEFGSYRVIDGASGWMKSSTRSPLFGDYTSTSSSVKKYFVLINDTDTCTVNINEFRNIETDDGSWFSQNILNSTPELTKAQGVFEAEFQFSADTAVWMLAVIFPVAVEIDGTHEWDKGTKFQGILTNNHTSIEIKEVTLRQDGKSPLLSMLFGYEFMEGSQSLGAVQVRPSNKMYVWLRDDLDNSLKFILANAAVAMLVKTY